ncbi:MAG: SDR family oxidoreductase [Candidatus Scalindua sp.]|nr:SDR family oxidoreductase [Candidatus Scalindua sp.]
MLVSTLVTTKVLENADPARWKEHLFGLPPERWGFLSGLSFWITGAGTGYGRALSCVLAAAGAQVFLTGRRIEKLKESLEEMSSFGITADKCHIVPADLTCEEDIIHASDTVRKLCRELHGLVNNAAVPSKPGSIHPLEDDSIEYWDKIFSTNVRAPWLVTRSIFPHMQICGKVKVVFITSEAGWAGTSGVGMYNVSKAALNSLGYSMAQEYSQHYPNVDIQMNVVVPGEARTEMNQGTTVSPYSIASIILILLSHPEGGPNGKFFHRDGRHLQFCYAQAHKQSLLQTSMFKRLFKGKLFGSDKE